MEQTQKKNTPWGAVFLLGMLIGAIWFIINCGVGILDPTRDGWILNRGGDISQHYIGWEFFRKSPWHFPLGLTDGIIDDQSVSCMFTDSIPLFAIFFKLLSPVLPETFQYMGFWGIFSYSMQGGISSLILYRLTKRPVFSLVGCTVYVLCPPIMQRMYGHESLAGQWVLLIAILSWVCQGRKWRFKATPVIIWAVNGILAVLVHIYFIPMIYIIMLGYIATDLFGRKKLLRPILTFVSTTASALLTMFIIGAFSGSGSYRAGGLGKYSANYNALFNSQGKAKYIASLNFLDGQYEGFAYLGLGIILGGAIALVLVVARTEKNPLKQFAGFSRERKAEMIAMLGIFVLSMVIAASPRGTFNGRIIYDIKLPDTVFGALSIFRATGRFAWVSVYIVYTSVLFAISKLSGRRTAMFCMVLVTAVQLLDLRVMMKNEDMRAAAKKAYEDPLKDAKWEELAEEADQIVFAPLPVDYLAYYEIFYAFGEYADENDIELSSFAVARGNYSNLRDDADEKLQQVIDGTADENYIVVFINEEDVPEANENFTVYVLDGFNVAVNFS